MSTTSRSLTPPVPQRVAVTVEHTNAANGRSWSQRIRRVARLRLRTQLLVAFLVVGAAPLTLIAVVGATLLMSWVQGDAARRLLTEARTVADRVDEYVERHQRGVGMLAQAPLEGPDGVPLALEQRMGRIALAFDGFLTLLIADSTGRIIAGHVRPPAGGNDGWDSGRVPQQTADAVHRSPVGAAWSPVSDRPYFRVPMATNRAYTSDAFRGRGFGTAPIVALSAPMRDSAHRPVAVAEGSLELQRFSRFARGTLAMPGAFLVLLDRTDRVVYAAGTSQFKTLQAADTTAFGRAVHGLRSSGSTTYEDGTGAGPWLVAVSHVPRTGWRVAVAQPRDIADAAARRYLLTVVGGILVALLLGVALALRLSRRITSPVEGLVRALRAFGHDTTDPVQLTTGAGTPAEVSGLVHEFERMSVRVHQADTARRASEAQFRAVFDHAGMGIAVHDEEGRLLETNPAFQRLVGYSAAELQTMRAHELSPAEDAEVTRGPVRALRRGEVDVVHAEKRFLHRSGREMTCELTVSRLDQPGVSGGMVGMVQDVTERRRLERELAWRANHDPLTGLANRAQFQERLERALTNMRVPHAVAVLVLDLDEFKRVNDSLGHGEGDRLLRDVARRLASTTRGSDLVARLGGDEFAILLDGIDKVVDGVVAARRVLSALERPMALDVAEVVLSCSIGIAYSTGDAAVDTLMRNADTAMYHAKQRGKATYEVFTAAMHEMASQRLTIEGAMRRALESGEFRAHYQPIVNLASGACIGAETLVRWSPPGQRSVPPATFIPIAEQTGLIIPLGRWILHEACRQGAAWTASMAARTSGTDTPPPFTLTVNISGRQLRDDGLERDVHDALATSGYDPRGLVLELTESVLMDDPDTAIRRLEALRRLGIRIAIDDFGTGYSSLSYLQRVPADVLKLDRSFVVGMTRSPREAALVRAVLRLGESLSLRCVAEGVEDVRQHEALLALGCSYAQGYFYAKPLPPDEAGRIVMGAHAAAEPVGA